MAEITQVNVQDFDIQTYETQESNLLLSFDVGTTFSSQSYIEYFVYDLNKNLFLTDYNFNQYTLQNIQNNPDQLSEIVIDPSQSLVDNGFDQGVYISYYNFLDKKIGSDLEQLYISEISNDRTEIRLDSTALDELSLIEQSNKFIQERQESDYFVDFYLNFGDNNLILANNIALDLQDPTNSTILIKLYEPLPDEFDLNSTCWVVITIEEPVAYQVTFDDPVFEINDTTSIQGPNFNLNIKDQVNNSTTELTYSDLISTSLTSSQQQLASLLEEKEIDVNIDYTTFDGYIHFSSAETRLRNFYYKIQLIEQYSSSISVLNSTTNSDISGSISIYQSKIDNIITNFDGYDYFLYYENNPIAWPKTTNQKPYELAKSDSPTVLSWIGSTNESSPYYGGLLLSASLYDNENKDNLLYSIPEYLRDDSNNYQYELFVQMVAQHYDNIWVYYKEITKKYDNDNRLEYGVSKDIVADAIRDFGIKLYQNNFSNDDLYTAFLGLTPEGGLFPFPNITGSLPTPSGFEYIDQFISASNNYMPLDDVNKSLYKRIYHNLPYLLKSKGTLPGLRALITSYGIPDTILRINEYGGKDKVDLNDWDYWQNEFNYAFNTSGSNFISSSWVLNSDWNAPNDVPSTLMFRFKTEGLPTSSIAYSQSLWYGDGGSAITLTYTGSAYASGSYSGSIIDPYYLYSTLTFYPDITDSSQTASIYLPFYDEGWWSVMVTKNSNTYTLYSQNKIYEGGDNGTLLGFKASSSVTYVSSNWNNTVTSYFPVSFSVLSSTGYDISAYDVGIYDDTGAISGLFTPFSGSYQEIRYYAVSISESVFTDYTMNPHSIEGNSLNSSPNELAFRASIGGEQYTASISIHPKITGSWQTTHSFASDSNFYYDASPNFIPNVEYTFADQPVAGIRNTISDKIRIENNVLPEGNTLSPFMSLSQMVNISQSYTPNINYLEVAFSPQNEINEDIVDQLGYFNIGEFIGDPRLRSSSAVTYPALDQLRNEYFEKYTSNYNLTDFIRLIKFFDNSLFKMIRDFVPARTSLASGIVIKQHLLERNKYPQPQMEWEDLDISGTLKPTWNDYEPGTVENFSGGTGGVFDTFNSILNTSQSWYETIQTPSGSVLVLHDNQDEFYNGEFSGSVLIVTTQSLAAPYPNVNILSSYSPILYRNGLYGLLNTNTLTSDTFFNSKTTPYPGEILILAPYAQSISYSGLPITASIVPSKSYLKINKFDQFGNDNTIILGNASKILIEYTTTGFVEYNIIPFNESSTYYTYEVVGNPIPINGSGVNTEIKDYYVSASRSTFRDVNDFASWVIQGFTTEDGNLPHYGTPYFSTSSGLFTLENTPNVSLQFSMSFLVDPKSADPSSYGQVSLYRLTNGEYQQINNNTFASVAGAGFTHTFYTLLGTPGLNDDVLYFLLEGFNNSDYSASNFQFTLTQSIAPTSSFSSSVIVEPYITFANYDNTDFNPLFNNVFELRDSSYYMDVDYSRGLTEPVNFNQLVNGIATRAKVQDSNYTSKRVTIPRYEGSKSTSQQLNKWTKGDIGTFGKLPTVESLKSYVAYGYMDGSYSPELMNASVFTIKYLIDQDGNISTPNISDISLPNTQQNFSSRDRFRYSSILGQSGAGGIDNQFRNIIRGGYRIEPILYTQKGVAPNVTWEGILFESLLPTSTNPVGNYTAKFLYNGGTITLSAPFPQSTTINYNSTIYGSSFLTGGGYQVPQGAVDDAVSLKITAYAGVTGRRYILNLPLMKYNVRLELLKGTTTVAEENFLYDEDGQDAFYDISKTISPSDLNVGDIYTLKVTCTDVSPNLVGFQEELYVNSSRIEVEQTPPYVPPSAYTGSIWGYLDPINYPYIITSSVSEIVESYGVNIKQSDISQSGFNPITLPWSIQYGDEFRFEGREDLVYQVGKIFAPEDSGSGRISQTGSIEVHFSTNLPINASSSAFDLDHFLIRRYVDDASQIIFEGFRPIGGESPNSFIITPEYVIPKLNKDTDEFVKLLTEKGLIG